MVWKKELKKTGVTLGPILLFSFVIRVLNLDLLPIFTDEAIYVRWSQIANRDPAWRFISLTDGKQPLFIWLSIVGQRIFSDPLFAGRIVSVIAGTLSTLGFYFLGKELFGKKVAIFSAIIWMVLPFSVWHSRLSLMDSLLAFFAVWVLWLQVLLVKKPRMDIALLLGMVIGGGLLVKSSAQFFLFLLPLSLFLKKRKELKKSFLLRWAGLALLVVFLAQAINSIQRLSPFYYMVGLKNLTFIYSFSELLSFGLFNHWQRFWGNLRGLSWWTAVYLTLPFLALLSFSLMKVKKDKAKKFFLLAWFLFPFFALAFFGKVLYPRFVLFMTIPLIILIADGLVKLFRQIKDRFLLFIFALLLFSYPFYFDYQIVFNPVAAPLPSVDRGQYLDDWPAGWGIREVIEFLKEKSKEGKLAVATEGTFGLTPYALDIYLDSNENVEIKGFWPISNGVDWFLDKAIQKPTYVLFKDTQVPDPNWPLELVAKYKRGRGNNYLGFYRVVK